MTLAAGTPSLTETEHRVVALLGEAYSLYAREIVADGRTRDHDLGEFAARIHDLQHAVMAQAAARAYPDLYRLAGGTIDRPAQPSTTPPLRPSAERSSTSTPVRSVVTDHEDAFADAAMQAMDADYQECPHDE